MVLTIFSFLPPANEVWGKVIFSQASVILFTGGGVHGMHAPWAHTPPGKHTPWACTPPHLRAHMPPDGYYEMWSMSGWYASYWNAFFLFFNFWFPKVQIQNLKGSTGEELILTPQWGLRSWLCRSTTGNWENRKLWEFEKTDIEQHFLLCFSAILVEQLLNNE